MLPKWLEWAYRIQTIAKAGLTYTENDYDIDRYNMLNKLSMEIMAEHAEVPFEKAHNFFSDEKGYLTPKIDVRSAVFKDGKILLVKERADGCWAMPGGWADIGLSPSEVAVKEIWEETGYKAKIKRLIALYDKKCHPHPPTPYYTYKLVFLAEITGGEATVSIETTEIDFFDKGNLPPLSMSRNTPCEILPLFDFISNPDKLTIFD